MVRKLLSTCLLFLFVGSLTTAYGQVKIGYMDTQDVMNQLPQRDDVQQQLNNFIQQKRASLQQRTSAFQDSVADFQQNQPSMSSAQAEQEQQKLSQMEASLRQFQQNIQQQIEQKRATLLEPLYDTMDKAIAYVAEQQGLDFVINKSTSSGENVVYYAAKENLDITQDVLNHIKETSAKN